LRALALVEHPVEQRRLVDDLKLGAAEFTAMPRLHLAAQRRHHGLLAIANAEHGHAGAEHRLWGLRRAALMHASGTARQDDGLGQNGAEARFGLIERHDLGIDPRLAHAARNELGHLAAEIDDQHPVASPVMSRILGVFGDNFVHLRHGRWL